jgi:predicted XRE-type DNA-binding protein
MTSQSFVSVWDAIEKSPEAAAAMKMRSTLLVAIEQEIEGWEVTKAVAARRLGITRPRLNALLRGKIDKFSLDILVRIAAKAGLKVRMQISSGAKVA